MRFLVLALMGMMACSGGSDDTDDTGATEDDDLEEDDDDDDLEDDDDDNDDADPVRVDAVLALSGDIDNGATLYDANCAVCHGLNGEGGVGPSMANALGEADPEIIGVILAGEGTMPAFDDWTDQEVADVLAFIRDTF